jgi:hypothetical protein
VSQTIALTPETAVPIWELRSELSIFHGLDHGNEWTGHVRGSPSKWKQVDGDAVIAALAEAKRHPVIREFDPARLQRRPRFVTTKTLGPVTIPVADVDSIDALDSPGDQASSGQPTEHTEIQWRLLKLGSDLGFDVWAAKSDKSRLWQGERLADVINSRTKLPLQFDVATNQTIENIDVLWLKANSIIAAFEIESTTPVYSGLLRMGDLIAMQPNLSIPLYVVAPDERREKVLQEVNRPTFAHLSPPLSQSCRLIVFSSLRSWLERYASVIKFMRPEFLEEVSEPCDLGDE